VLGPGILVTLLPSILATMTDPRTERAILVIGLALVAILAGNNRRLASPFIIGIIVLPIENIIVLAGQVGNSIGAVPWWITLATAGAVLLVIAVSTERRNRSESGGVGRLRDLK
jgi:peptidoglycan/LPS O-acetylase OafA/YrhL